MSAPKKFLLFGDSITEFTYEPDQWCLGPALQNVYARKMDIIQRGYIGYNSRWALHILPELLDGVGKVDLAYVFFGTNDCMPSGQFAVPLEEYLDNMKKIVTLMTARGIKVIVIGTSLIELDRWNELNPSENATGLIRNTESQKFFGDKLRELCKQENYVFVDLHKKFTELGGAEWKSLLKDGLHFNSFGYKIFYDELLRVIKENYPEFHPSNMHYQYPECYIIDRDMKNLVI